MLDRIRTIALPFIRLPAFARAAPIPVVKFICNHTPSKGVGVVAINPNGYTDVSDSLERIFIYDKEHRLQYDRRIDNARGEAVAFPQLGEAWRSRPCRRASR